MNNITSIKHAEKRHNVWYALLTIPEDVRPIIGKVRFLQSTQSTDAKEAAARVPLLISGWKAQIAAARATLPDTKAAYWENLQSQAVATLKQQKPAELVVIATPANEGSPAITMSSLEMVAYINALRKPGEAELHHRTLMVKVPLVLGGEILAAEFSASSFYTNGAGHRVHRNIYNFPKREALMMAMSYSYELSAKVLDRMMELEAALIPKAPAVPTDFVMALRLAADTQEALNVASLQITVKDAQITAQAAQIAIEAPQALVYRKVIADKGMTIATHCRTLNGVNTIRTKSDLVRLGYLYRNKRHGYSVRTKHLNVLFEETAPDDYGNREITLTDEGIKLLTALYDLGRLTMKVGFKG